MFHVMRVVSTEADVSFFSTLGCSLGAALTTGSMALLSCHHSFRVRRQPPPSSAAAGPAFTWPPLALP